jgi:hypothetical protein
VVKLETAGFGVGGERYEEEEGKRRKMDAAVVKKRNTYLVSKIGNLRSSGHRNNLTAARVYLDLHTELLQNSSHPLSPLQLPKYHRFDKPYWEVPRSDQSGVVLTTQLADGLEI